MKAPSIGSSRLNLRPFSLDDLTPFHQILGEDAVLRYFPNSNPPSRERVEKMISGQLNHWSEHGYGWWAVEPKSEQGKMIGWCGLQYLPETDEIEVSNLLSRSYWGKGLATEGALAGLEYGFDRLNIERIVGIIHQENIASGRVLENLGMGPRIEAEYFGMTCFRYEIYRADFYRNKNRKWAMSDTSVVSAMKGGGAYVSDKTQFLCCIWHQCSHSDELDNR